MQTTILQINEAISVENNRIPDLVSVTIDHIQSITAFIMQFIIQSSKEKFTNIIICFDHTTLCRAAPGSQILVFGFVLGAWRLFEKKVHFQIF